jgi:SAM-dependent methyltransferase
MTMQYYPGIFDVADEQGAKAIILTPEGPGADTETRWALETPYVLELIVQSFQPHSGMVVLDYGCGIGRMARALIQACGCCVIGVDISPQMRRLAVDYVGSDRFVVVSPGQFDLIVAAGLQVHAAISVWVLQHCLAPSEDIARMKRGLTADGRGFILNMPTRAIPAVRDAGTAEAAFAWASDNVDVASLLRAAFDVMAEGEPDRSRTPNMADVGAYWMRLRRRNGA